MTKRHFEALAKAFKVCLENRHRNEPCGYDQWLADVHAVTNVCAQFNPRFDQDKFLKACGVES